MPEASRWAFEDLLDRRFLQLRYEPIVDLVTGTPVGAEAMARWPELGILPGPAYQWASAQGRLAELDAACREAAIDEAIARGLDARLLLFVGLQPSVIGPDTASRLRDRVIDRAGLVVEIVGWGGPGRWAPLLRAVGQLRDSGCAIALEDTGASVDAALLRSIRPDVIKLDISTVGEPVPGNAIVTVGVTSYAERTGAAVLADGIGTEEHLERAIALGATLGEGWYFSRGGPLGSGRPPAGTTGRRLPHEMDMAPDDVAGTVEGITTRVAGEER